MKRVLVFLAALTCISALLGQSRGGASGPQDNRLSLGATWSVDECCGWTGTWQRRAGTNVFDARWTHTNGTVVTDVVRLVSWNEATGEVVFSRDANHGTYRAFLDASRQRLLKGTASWYPQGLGWTARAVDGGPGAEVRPIRVAGESRGETVTARLKPTDAAQVVAFGDSAQVLVPGRLLSAPASLTMAPIRNLDALVLGGAAVAGLDVSIGSLRDLPVPLTIEFAYPASLTRTLPASQLLGVRWDESSHSWHVLPTSVDAARRIATVTTRHLCAFVLLSSDTFEPYHARQFGWTLPPDTPEYRRAASTPPDFMLTVVTSRFAHDYNRGLENAVKWPAAAVWPGRPIPVFVQATAKYLEDALEQYKAFVPPPLERIGPLAIAYRPYTHPAAYVHNLDAILVDTSFATGVPTPALHRYRTAHELFHSLQNQWLGGGRTGGAKCIDGSPGFWWVEAAADVAACRVAWNFPDQMGKSVDDIYPYGLEYPLNRTGFVENLHAMPVNDFDPWKRKSELEYQRAYFLSYLMDHGADFADMSKAVMTAYPRQ